MAVTHTKMAAKIGITIALVALVCTFTQIGILTITMTG
ncbi:hypothetical protein C5S53_08400 [Methanophagales archaeon]|nr:hypothetical protein C5S53_08400 [Methanophagales archaeon]